MGTEKTANNQDAPARKVWVINETADSNPRLSENLSLLSDALHMELKLVEREALTGSYSGDTLTDDKQSDAAIVVEHRSDWTDHTQLGQVLTCAENYNARILIWIAQHIREEHRSALDWLNRWTPEAVEVYGVEIRSTQEGDAGANPEFVPVIAPAYWSKRNVNGQIPKVQSVALREFFQPLIDELRNAGFTSRRTGAAVPAYPFPSGIYGITYYASLESDGRAWVYIVTHRLKSKLFGKLREDSENIECELELKNGLSARIDWVTGASNIGVWRDGSLNDSAEELKEIRQWMSHYLRKFYEVFTPRMKKILAELETDDA